MAHTNKKQVALYLTDAESRMVSAYAKKMDISRTKLMSSLILGGLSFLSRVDQVEPDSDLNRVD